MENIDKKRKRVEILIDYIIKTSFADIDIKNDDDRYDNMYNILDTLITKVCDSRIKDNSIDDLFLTDKLDGMNEFERKEVFTLARKYSSLCFFQGDIANWIDSPMGFPASKSEDICKDILDDYDYLIEITRDGKEDSLRFLLELQNSDISNEGPVISVLRSKYKASEFLKNIIVEMSNVDGKYKDFSLEQKVILFTNAEGVLYKQDGSNDVEIIDPLDIESEIVKYCIGEIDNSLIQKDIMKSIDNETFRKAVEEINNSYLEEKYGYKK